MESMTFSLMVPEPKDRTDVFIKPIPRGGRSSNLGGLLLIKKRRFTGKRKIGEHLCFGIITGCHLTVGDGLRE